MCIVICLVPATAWLVISYIVFFLADRSEGRRKVLGRALGLWALGIALCIFVFGAIVQFVGNSAAVERRISRLLKPPETTKTIHGSQEAGRPW